MPEAVKYNCSCCGKEHEEWPALTFDSPMAYDILTEKEKKEIAEIDSDFCVIRYSDQTDRFIRVTFTQKVIDYCEDLEYGVWVSLSEKSFNDYVANFKNNVHKTMYFGWLSNQIPGYEMETIPTTVHTRTGNLRPQIVPHENFDHPFVRDYYKGITKTEAEKRIKQMLQLVAEKNVPDPKPWWKFW